MLITRVRTSIALGLTLMLAAITLVACGGGGDDEIGLFEAQSISDSGPSPFTDSVAAEPSDEVMTFSETGAPVPAGKSAQAPVAPAPTSVSGDTVGLYGGTETDTGDLTAQCDRQQLIDFLSEDESKGAAWAEVQHIDPAQIATYINSLTPFVLTVDTLVTNHGYQDGQAVAFLALLQRGTAVLVDAMGVPRARCYCGNPLTPPSEYVPPPGVQVTTSTTSSTSTTYTTTPPFTTLPPYPPYTVAIGIGYCEVFPQLCGQPPADGDEDIPWETFDPVAVQIVNPAPQPIVAFAAVDIVTGAITPVTSGSEGMGMTDEGTTTTTVCASDQVDEAGNPICATGDTVPDDTVPPGEDTIPTETFPPETLPPETFPPDTEPVD